MRLQSGRKWGMAAMVAAGLGVSSPGGAGGLPESELAAVRAGFEARRDAMLQLQIDDPFPEAKLSSDGKSQMNLYVWHYLDFALAALYRNQRVPEANDAILKVCEHYKSDPQTMVGNKGFYWAGNLFLRVYEFFHAGSRFFPGRLRPDVEAAMLELMWNWGKSRGRVEEAEIDDSRTWRFWGSDIGPFGRKTRSTACAAEGRRGTTSLLHGRRTTRCIAPHGIT